MTTETRELKREEFFMAENVWKQYRGQKADPENERIFGVFENGTLVATARYTKHPDGIEMDCVFVSDTYRSKGYAGEVVRELIRLCGQEPIYIHSTLALIRFYKTFGFTPIPEDQLPTTIRERFLFCFGEMEGCNICPMVRQGPAVV